MKRTNICHIFAAIVLGLAILTACSDKKDKSGRTDTPSSGAIKFASDESFSPIIEETREHFEFLYPEAHLTPIYTNQIDAVDMLMRGKLQLVIAASDFSPKQYKYLKDQGFMPKALPIAYDGLALIVNTQNTDSCITVKDVVRILKGEATRWTDIYPGSRCGDIQVVFDNAKSGTVKFVEDSILHGSPITSENAFAQKNSKAVVDYVEKNTGAIGIIGSNWLNDKRDTTNTTFNKNIRVMRVSKMDVAKPGNSWQPYQAYFLDDRYAFIRTIYALMNDPRHGLPWSYGNFLGMPIGAKILFRAGLLPYRADIEINEVTVSR